MAKQWWEDDPVVEGESRADDRRERRQLRDPVSVPSGAAQRSEKASKYLTDDEVFGTVGQPNYLDPAEVFGEEQPQPTKKERTFGEKAADMARTVGAAGVSAIGAIPTAAGRAIEEGGQKLFGLTMDEARRMAEADGTPDRALEYYEKANRLNPVAAAGRAIESGGRKVMDVAQGLRDARSEEAKQAIQDSTPTGDITSPSTWTAPKDPSVEGVLGVGAEGVGSMAPSMATAIATRGRSADTQMRASGGSVAAQVGGAAMDEAGDYLGSFDDQALAQASPVFRNLVDKGYKPEQARALVLRDAENRAAAFAAPAGMAGGKATAALLGKWGERVAAGAITPVRAAVLAALGATEEGLQEVAEGLATRAGINDAAGTDRSVTEGTLEEFTMGAMGGGPVAGGRAVMDGARRQLARQPNPEAASTQDLAAAASASAQELVNAAQPPGAAPATDHASTSSETPPAIAGDPQWSGDPVAGAEVGVVPEKPAGPPPLPPEARLAELDLLGVERDLSPEERAEAHDLMRHIDERDHVEADERDDARLAVQYEADVANAVESQEDTTQAADLDRRAGWLNIEARARGFQNADELQTRSPAAFERLTALWRERNPLPEQAARSRALAGVDPALQNRDRSRASSVAQMATIARNPDYLRLGTSRTPDAGAPMVFATGDDQRLVPNGNLGRSDVAVMADGQRVPFRYAVVDADDVQPSHFADGQLNPGFSMNAPGVLKALNNGRSAALRAAYQEGTADEYREALIADAEAHGVTVAAIQRTANPVLVRVYSERSNTPDMAAKSQAQSLGMSPGELAAQDAQLVDTELLAAYRGGDVASAANRDLARGFIGRLQQRGQDVSTLMAADGALSQTGRQRMQAALVQAAYGRGELVEELFDSLDTDIRAIGEALKTVAPAWADMRDSARYGLINPEADITGNLVQALDLIRRARREHRSLYDLARQPDLLTGQSLDLLTQGALRFFYGGEYLTRAHGRSAMVGALQEYVRTAMSTSAKPDMFGHVTTPDDVLAGIVELEGALDDVRDPTEASRELAHGGGVAGSDPLPSGAGEQRRGDPASGAEPREDQAWDGTAQPRAARRGDASAAQGTAPAALTRAQEPDNEREDAERHPNAAPADRGAAEAGSPAADPLRRSGRAVPGRPRVRALGIAAEIQRAGSAALVGRTVESADELAELAQVYRDPRYETFRVFLLQGNRVVHATGVSARLPGQAPMFPAGMADVEYVQQLRDLMAQAGADGYYMLHNHPSGNPEPSFSDQSATQYLAAHVPGMRGHVVINSNRYAVIEPDRDVRIESKDFGADLLLQASCPSPLLDAWISSPDELTSVGKALQKPGWLTLIGTNQNRVRLVVDVPEGALGRPPRVLAAMVRRFMRQSGARSMFLVGSDADVASQPLQEALRQGILRDAVGHSGRSQAQRGVAVMGQGFDRTPGRAVAEDGDGYRRDTIGSNPPPDIPPGQQNAWTRAKAAVMRLTSPEGIDRLLYEFQDKLVDLKRLRDHIRELGGTITDLNDAYLGEELFHKRLAKRTEDFLDRELRPLLADMRARGVSMTEMERFLHARHAPEANRVLAERNPTKATIDAKREAAKRSVRDLEAALERARRNGSATRAIEEALDDARTEASNWIGAQPFRGSEPDRLALSGMSDAEARAFMDSLPAARRAALDALAARVDQIQAGTLRTLDTYGLVDRETLAAWGRTYRHYVPLHRDEAHAESDRHPIGQGFSVRGSGAKTRVGSNEKVTNILAHIALQREAALTRGEKNLVVKKLYLMAAQNPDEGFWSLDAPPRIKALDSSSGTVRTMVDPRYKHLPNVVMVRIAGRDHAVVFNEHNPRALRLAESMKNLDIGDLHVILGLAAKGTRWFASVNTQYNPVFGLINFARDVQAGLLNLSTTPLAGQQRVVAAHVLTAVRAIYRERRGKAPASAPWAALWEEFQAVGGTTGYRDLFADADDRARALARELRALDRGQVSKAAHAVVDWLSDYNEVMENAVRLAAYRVALDQGMSKERAASLSKNLTVNFNRKGRQTREIGALYAFFNAALQGTARMVDTLRGPVGRRIMFGGVALGALNALIGMAVMGGGDDDEPDNWAQIPEFVKERSLVIPLGREDYLTIPMPLGFHVFPNIGRKAVEFTFGHSGESAGAQLGDLLMVLADAFNPLGGAQNLSQMVAPTVIDPVVALMENRDWTGRPIYREDISSLDPQPGHRLAKDSASTPSRLIAEAINHITGGTDYRPGAWSPTPDQLDYVVGQLTGGLGREMLKVNQTLAAPFTGDELPPHKVPLLGRLYGNTRGPSGQAAAYYDNVRTLNELERELKGRLRNRGDVDALRREEPLVALVGQGNQTQAAITKLRRQRAEIVERQAEGYQERVRAIDAQIGQVMTRLNQDVATTRRRANP